MPRSADELQAVMALCTERGMATHVLGRGTNLLIFDDGLAGGVISTRRLDDIVIDGRILRAGAGAYLPRVINASVNAGLRGLQGLAGIPGSIGGSLVMNAGGRHGEICDALKSVLVLDAKGRLRRLMKTDIRIGYRRTSLHEFVVAEAEFELTRASVGQLRRERLGVLNEKKSAQPMSMHSAGCVFKNPTGDSAGRIIDELNLKNAGVGDARVSEKHANFIVNRKRAKAADVLELIATIQQAVNRKHGLELELEVEVWRDPMKRLRSRRRKDSNDA